MPLSDDLLDAAERLKDLGFGLADAVHLAAARQLGVNCFLTVDDKLRKRASRLAKQVGVRVIDPVAFLAELNDATDG